MDIESISITSYREKLVCNSSTTISLNFSPVMSSFHITPEETNHYNLDNFIPLYVEDKIRLYKPWKIFLIIKLFRKKLKILATKTASHVESIRGTDPDEFRE